MRVRVLFLGRLGAWALKCERKKRESFKERWRHREEMLEVSWGSVRGCEMGYGFF